jgi:hypothetical protein
MPIPADDARHKMHQVDALGSLRDCEEDAPIIELVKGVS